MRQSSGKGQNTNIGQIIAMIMIMMVMMVWTFAKSDNVGEGRTLYIKLVRGLGREETKTILTSGLLFLVTITIIGIIITVITVIIIIIIIIFLIIILMLIN